MHTLLYSVFFCLMFFFFFKQKTAYEMRISDWSSDVCSSDLDDEGGPVEPGQLGGPHRGRQLLAHRPHHVIGGQHAEEVHERQHYRAPFAAMHPAAAVAHPLPVIARKSVV